MELFWRNISGQSSSSSSPSLSKRKTTHQILGLPCDGGVGFADEVDGETELLTHFDLDVLWQALLIDAGLD